MMHVIKVNRGGMSAKKVNTVLYRKAHAQNVLAAVEF